MIEKEKKPWRQVDSNSGPLDHQTIAFTPLPPPLPQTILIMWHFRLVAKFTEEVTSTLEGNSLKVSGVNVKAGALINRTIYQDVYRLIKTAVCWFYFTPR